MHSIAAIILAAGRATRFGAGPDDSKVLAKLDGASLLRRVAVAASQSKAQPVIAVVGHAFAKVEAELRGFDFQIIRNHDLDLGLSHSLKLGLSLVPETASGAIVLLADMPYVTAKLVDDLVRAFETAAEKPLAVVPVRSGARGNPVVLSREIFAEAKAVGGDRGARGLLDKLTHGVLEVGIDTEAIAVDVDTRETLDRLADGPNAL